MRPWMRGGLALQEDGDFATYEAQLREALPKYRDAGDQFMTAVCLDLVAELDEARGAFDDAAAHLREAIDIVAGWRMAVFEVALTARFANAAVEVDDSEAEELLRPRAYSCRGTLVYAGARGCTERSREPTPTSGTVRRSGSRHERTRSRGIATRTNMDSRARSHERRPRPTCRWAQRPRSRCSALLPMRATTRILQSHAFDPAYEQVQALASHGRLPSRSKGWLRPRHTAGNDVWAAQLLGGADVVRSATGAKPSPTEQTDLKDVRDAVLAGLGAAELENGARCRRRSESCRARRRLSLRREDAGHCR